jgi:TonB family protein
VEQTAKTVRPGVRAKTSYKVHLEAIIDSDGTVPKVKVINSSSESNLDTQAIALVKTWKFKPARLRGFPVPISINVEVDFTRSSDFDLPQQSRCFGSLPALLS